MLRIFGEGKGPLDLYRFGPHPELVGRPLTELAVAPEPGGELRLDRPELYDEIDLDAHFLPARVIGEIRHRQGRGALDLAITVGDTVQAVPRTLSNIQGNAKFAAMLPESAFSAGRNEVRVFIVTGESGAPRLIPTRKAPRKGRVERLLGRLRDAYSS